MSWKFDKNFSIVAISSSLNNIVLLTPRGQISKKRESPLLNTQTCTEIKAVKYLSDHFEGGGDG